MRNPLINLPFFQNMEKIVIKVLKMEPLEDADADAVVSG